MKKNNWRNMEQEDDLNIGSAELQELEDDELSLAEAAFYEGYMDSEIEEAEDYY